MARDASHPHAAMATNQTIITGPKIRPTAAVPLHCTAKSTTMITAVTGMINGRRGADVGVPRRTIPRSTVAEAQADAVQSDSQLVR